MVDVPGGCNVLFFGSKTKFLLFHGYSLEWKNRVGKDYVSQICVYEPSELKRHVRAFVLNLLHVSVYFW